MAFAVTAIYPLGPEKVLNQLKKKTSSPISSDYKSKRKTLDSVQGVCRAIKAVQSETVNMTAEMNLIIQASEKLATRNNILKHKIRELCTALIDKKKHQKREQLMSLFMKDELRQAMFFSSAKITAVQTRQEELEAQREQEKLEKEVKCQDKAAERERKAQKAQEQRETR